MSQRDFGVPVGRQIPIERRHGRIRSLPGLRVCRDGCAWEYNLQDEYDRKETELHH